MAIMMRRVLMTILDMTNLSGYYVFEFIRRYTSEHKPSENNVKRNNFRKTLSPEARFRPIQEGGSSAPTDGWRPRGRAFSRGS
jgi:hypothetical protein